MIKSEFSIVNNTFGQVRSIEKYVDRRRFTGHRPVLIESHLLF